jgi:hypothetical protein
MGILDQYETANGAVTTTQLSSDCEQVDSARSIYGDRTPCLKPTEFVVLLACLLVQAPADADAELAATSGRWSEFRA